MFHLKPQILLSNVPLRILQWSSPNLPFSSPTSPLKRPAADMHTLETLVEQVQGDLPDDAVLTQMHHQLGELASSAQTSIQALDRQLDKLSKTRTAVAAELAKRKEQPAENGVKAESLDIDVPKRFVPNPKSEFVNAQFMPIEKLGLFEEEEGDEGIKKKLGVVSYPQSNLMDMLPGPYPDDDFSKATPQNQVQFSTFWTFLEPYFRNFTEEDLSFFQQKAIGLETVNFGRALSPYVIPPLGPVYTDQWAEEDGPANYHVQPPPAATSVQQYTASGSLGQLSDENLAVGKVMLGPLGARLMGAILPEDEDEAFVPSCASELPQAPLVKEKHPFASFAMLEDRLRREFHYVGLVDVQLLHKAQELRNEFKLAVDVEDDTDIDWVNMTEDDEICREMRKLQKDLKRVSAQNQKYKRRLLPHIEEQMAWQEYSSILEDLDKQVDQAYLRRLRVPKAKKQIKKEGFDTPPPSTPKFVDQKPAVQALLEKRERWVRKIGGVFPPQHLMLRSHEQNKFDGEDSDEEMEE